MGWSSEVFLLQRKGGGGRNPAGGHSKFLGSFTRVLEVLTYTGGEAQKVSTL